MLKLNIDRICRIRGIEKTFTFITRLGISNLMAHYLKSGTYERPPLKAIEKLCLELNCTPNDLFEWIPDAKSNIAANHPLQQLRRDPATDFSTIIKTMPLDQLNEIRKIIDERNKK